MKLSCLAYLNDPFPLKLGRKVEATKPISAEEQRALVEIAAFEACAHEAIDTFGKQRFAESLTYKSELQHPHDGTGYIEPEAPVIAEDEGRAVAFSTLLDHFDQTLKSASRQCIADPARHVESMLIAKFGSQWLCDIPPYKWPAVIAALDAI